MQRIDRFARAVVWLWATTIAIGQFMGWTHIVTNPNPGPVNWWKLAAVVAAAIGVGLWRRNVDGRKS